MTERPPLWAPWRMEYIGRPGEGRACIFCAAGPPGQDDDPKSLVVHRGRTTIVMLNLYPYAPGHLMVAPKVHVARLHELDRESRGELIGLVSESSRLLEQAYACEALNVGANLGRAAGAGFAEHVHFHVVPRWTGDTNFMTVLAETRVIPQHLERSYALLAPLFAELSA